MEVFSGAKILAPPDSHDKNRARAKQLRVNLTTSNLWPMESQHLQSYRHANHISSLEDRNDEKKRTGGKVDVQVRIRNCSVATR